MSAIKASKTALSGLWIFVLLLPSAAQVGFNLFYCSTIWYAYWLLSFVTSVVPVVWLLLGRKLSVLAAVLVQLLAVIWFNWQQCGIDNSTESAFVGGIGPL